MDTYLGAQEGDSYVGLGAIFAFGKCLIFFSKHGAAPTWRLIFLQKGLFWGLSREGWRFHLHVPPASCLWFLSPFSASWHTGLLPRLPCASLAARAHRPASTSVYESLEQNFLPPPVDNERLTRLISSFYPWFQAESSCELNWVWFLRFLEVT